MDATDVPLGQICAEFRGESDGTRPGPQNLDFCFFLIGFRFFGKPYKNKLTVLSMESFESMDSIKKVEWDRWNP